MKIVKVNTKKLSKEFLNISLKIYKNEKKWIQPLNQDINNIFQKNKNKTFRHGNLSRWILIEETETIGRIAAFYNNKTAIINNKIPTGGCGFFECINNSLRMPTNKL